MECCRNACEHGDLTWGLGRYVGTLLDFLAAPGRYMKLSWDELAGLHGFLGRSPRVCFTDRLELDGFAVRWSLLARS